MLILARKVDERIVIDVRGVEIELVVNKISGETVRIGVEAPSDVVVLRKELQNLK
jgi:carbon storage regulator CsrA